MLTVIKKDCNITILDDFPSEIADYDPEIKNRKVSAVHIRYIAIDEKYQHNRIGTATMQTIIKM